MSNLLDADQPPGSSEKKTFADKFTEERETWRVTVKEIATRFRSVENLAEVQVDLYSRRQEAVEYQFKLIGIVNKLKKSYVVEYKEAFDKAGKNEDLRYSEKEKTKAAESATAETKYKMDSVSSQIDYFRETIKTLDNMIFGVKHRIEIENFKIGMK